MIKNKTTKQLRKLALDMLAREVFTSQMIEPTEDVEIVESIFLPLRSMNQEQVAELKAYEPVMFYEYLDEAIELKVKGYPVFPTIRMLNMKEFEEYQFHLKMYKMALRILKETKGEGEII